MPTEKPRYSVILTEEEIEQIERYRCAHNIRSFSKALHALVLKGLGMPVEEKPAEPLSAEKMRLVRRFDRADAEGRAKILEAAMQARPARRPLPPDERLADARARLLLDDLSVWLDWLRLSPAAERDALTERMLRDLDRRASAERIPVIGEIAAGEPISATPEMLAKLPPKDD